MISIPEDLLEQVERDNVLLVVGEGINQGLLASSAELAVELAERCDYPPNDKRTLSRVAGYYQLTTHDRHGLIDFLRHRLDRPGLHPSPSHKQIVQLRPRIVVTTCYDHLLERAAQEAKIDYSAVVANEEVAYGNEHKMMLVWLWGVLDRPDSMIVTADDHRQFLVGRKNLSDVLRGELCRRTWLFLGFDAEDVWFRNFYDGVTIGLDRHRRRAYIVGTTLSAYTRAWWDERADFFDVDIEPFLSELANQLASRKRPSPGEREAIMPATMPLPERPYKKLYFYEGRDAPIFFGRGAEIQTLSSMIHAYRLVLLYGASGVGKTSLLKAGVMPRLEQAEPGYVPVYLRVLEDPAGVMREAVRRRLTGVELPTDGSLVDFFDSAARDVDRTLVIILDQFEEFFVRFGPQFRETFIAEIAALYHADDVPVKIVLSLREDWLASVNELRGGIPEVFQTDMRLLPLTREQALEAITAPAEQLGLRYDPRLVDRLLHDLTERAEGDEHALVMPPQLQLVCDAMYEHAHAQGRKQITEDDYESVGGVQGILVRYIETALLKYQSDERKVAKHVLMALVTSHETKTSSNIESLATELGEEEAKLERVLAHLIGQRLVRRLDEGQRYELAHDVLATTIASWVSEKDRQLKQVRELLRRELADWQQEPHILVSGGKFQRINAARENLRFTDEETAFLLRAAILYDEDVSYWLEQVVEPDAQIDILLEMLGSDASQARLTSAKFLVNYRQEQVEVTLACTALEDPEPSVRDMGAVSLGRMGGGAGTERLIAAVSVGEAPQRRKALRALALIQDVAPDQLLAVSGSTRFQVSSELTKIRFWRGWPRISRVTVVGAIGGAVGFGLGLVPLVLLQEAAVLGWEQVGVDLLWISWLFIASMGLVAGAAMALGITVGESLSGARVKLGRILGGTLLGGIGFAVLMLPLVNFIGSVSGNPLSGILASGLFGMLTALGITIPSAIIPKRAAVLAGGAVGAALGLVTFSLLWFPPGQDVSIALLLVCGGLLGLVMAFSVAWAEARWPLEKRVS